MRYLGVVGRPMFAAAFGEHQEEVSLLRVSRAANPIRHASLSNESHVEIYDTCDVSSWGCCRPAGQCMQTMMNVSFCAHTKHTQDPNHPVARLCLALRNDRRARIFPPTDTRTTYEPLACDQSSSSWQACKYAASNVCHSYDYLISLPIECAHSTLGSIRTFTTVKGVNGPRRPRTENGIWNFTVCVSGGWAG